jgi:hypothetical protein
LVNRTREGHLKVARHLARALVVVANGEDKGAPDSLYLFPSIFSPRPVVDEVAENLFKLGKNLSVIGLNLWGLNFYFNKKLLSYEGLESQQKGGKERAAFHEVKLRVGGVVLNPVQDAACRRFFGF